MTREQAIALYDSKFWEGMNYKERAEFQIMERRLCMPFQTFHEAVEKTLGRPVYTHEFGLNLDGLKAELFHNAPPPTLEQILDLIPADKRMVIQIGGPDGND